MLRAIQGTVQIFLLAPDWPQTLSVNIAYL
jgi:hypothetical protein